MALSNMLREPRRELIEQGFGFLAVAGVVAIDFAIAAGLVRWVDGTFNVATGEYIFAMLMAAVIMFFVFLLNILMHAIGEAVCAGMADRGYDPRPKNRYR